MRTAGIWFAIALVILSGVAFADSGMGYSGLFAIDNRDKSYVEWSYDASIIVNGEVGAAAKAFGFGIKGASVKAGVEWGSTREYEIEQVGSQTILRIKPRDKGSLVFGYDVGEADFGAVGATAFSAEAKIGKAHGTDYEFSSPLTDSGQAALAAAMIVSDAEKTCNRIAPGTGAFLAGVIDWLAADAWRNYATTVGGEVYFTAEGNAGDTDISIGPVKLYSQSLAGLDCGLRAYSEKDLRDGSVTRGLEASVGGAMTLPGWVFTGQGEGSFGAEGTWDSAGSLDEITCKLSSDLSLGVPFTSEHTIKDFDIVFTPRHCQAFSTALGNNALAQFSSLSNVVHLAVTPVGQTATSIVEPAVKAAIAQAGPVQFDEYTETKTLFEFKPEVEIQAGIGINVGLDLAASFGTRGLAKSADLTLSSGNVLQSNVNTYSRVATLWDGPSGILDFHKQLFRKACDVAKDAIVARLKKAGQWVKDTADHVVDAAEGAVKVLGKGVDWVGNQAQGVYIDITSWSPSIPVIGKIHLFSAPIVGMAVAGVPQVEYQPYRSSAVAPSATTSRMPLSENSPQPLDSEPGTVLTVVGDVHKVTVTDSSGTEITSYPSGSTQIQFTVSPDMLIAVGFKAVDAPRLRIYSYNSTDGTWYEVTSTQTVDPNTGNTVLTADLSGPGQYAAGIVGPPTDTANPSIAITSPANGASVSGIVTVSGTCGDDVAVSSVNLSVGNAINMNAPVVGSSWQCDIDASRLAPGSKTVTATATDTSGKTSSTAIQVTVGGSTPGSIASARQATEPYASVGNVVVTGGTDVFTGFFYIQSPTLVCGIRVMPIGADVSKGDIVSVVGLPQVVNGEAVIASADVSTVSRSNPLPHPLGIANRYLGGGLWGLQPAVGYGSGVTNVGLLVHVWGRVTQIGPDYLYIDDGSLLSDGTFTGAAKNIGVRVICDPSGYRAGDYLGVTGISSCFTTTGGKIAPEILTRSVNDVSGFGIAH